MGNTRKNKKYSHCRGKTGELYENNRIFFVQSNPVILFRLLFRKEEQSITQCENNGAQYLAGYTVRSAEIS